MLAPCERPTRELLSMNGTRATLEGIPELAKALERNRLVVEIREYAPDIGKARGLPFTSKLLGAFHSNCFVELGPSTSARVASMSQNELIGSPSLRMTACFESSSRGG